MPQAIPFTCRWSDSGVGPAWVHVAGDLDLATSPGARGLAPVWAEG